MEREVHLRDYIHIIRKRRFSALTFFAVVMTVVVIGTFSVKPTYMAKTRLLIEKVEPYTLVDYRFAVSDPDFYSTQYALIKSRPVTDKVVEALLRDEAFAKVLKKEVPLKPTGVMGFLQGIFSTLEQKSEEQWRSELGDWIIAGIRVNPVRDTRLVMVSYLSRYPEFSAAVANEMATAYIQALLEMRVQSSQSSMRWIAEQIDEERESLARSEKKLQAYVQANNIVTLEDRVTVLPQKLSELGTQITRAASLRKELENLNNKISELPSSLQGAESIPAIVADRTVGEIRSRIIASEQKVQELSKKYGEKHPQMIEARDELRSLNRQMISEMRRVIESIKTDYELALDKEEGLSRLMEQTKQEALDLKEKFIEYDVLKRDVETKRQLFNSLLKRMGEQSINEEVQTVNVIHLEPAKVPKKAYRPRKLLNVLLGLFVGLFGGVGVALFLEYFDNTLKTPDEVEEKLGVPVLGMIGFLEHEREDLEQKNIETIVVTAPKSTFSENYKALRTSILLSSAEAPPRRLLVTSMGSAEGKTSTSINLALVISQMEKRVLLVDCDLRKPRVHKIFGLENNVGVSTFVAGASSVDDIIRPAGDTALSVITAGPIPPNPSEILGSAKFDELMAAIDERFDMVIFDSPPLLSVTDSVVLSKKVENVMIVSRAGRVTYEAVAKGLKYVQDVKAKVLGIMLNAVAFRKGDYYYYKYHGYEYYYSGYSSYGPYYAESEEEADKDAPAKGTEGSAGASGDKKG